MGDWSTLLGRKTVLVVAAAALSTTAFVATAAADIGMPDVPASQDAATSGTAGRVEAEPAAEPTDDAAAEPAGDVSAEPTDDPSGEPTDDPSAEPTTEVGKPLCGPGSRCP